MREKHTERQRQKKREGEMERGRERLRKCMHRPDLYIGKLGNNLIYMAPFKKYKHM